MGRWLAFTAAIVLSAVLLLLWLREPLQRQVDARRVADMFVPVDRDDFDPGPATGSRFPGLRATWQGREITLLEPLAGPRGSVLVILRSLAWSPWCREELRQLQALLPAYQAAGIGLAVLSVDTPETLDHLASEQGIALPLLADQDRLSVTTLGLLGPAHPSGADPSGLPSPGSLVIDPHGTVVAKAFLGDPRRRVAPEAVLQLADRQLPKPGTPSVRESLQ